MHKPPYVIPTMKEIAKVKGTNGFNVVSTFSGAGGTCLGFEMAGFKILYANEFISQARDTYKANHPDVFLDHRDIRKVSVEDILKIINLSPGDLDILEGSPPCASFSTAGKRSKKWGIEISYSTGESQVTDDLFFEFIRLVKGIQPKIFVAENVKGLVTGKAKGYFKKILESLKGAGYKVEVRIINSAFLGVPQSRQRVFFIGVRNDLVNKFSVAPVFPLPLKYKYNIEDVINMKDSCMEDEETKTDITLPKSVLLEYRILKAGEVSKKYFQTIKPFPDRPSATVIVNANVSMHPYFERKYNLKELRRLCSYPEDFILTGSYANRWERIGRSVMPFVSFAIAQRLRDDILRITNG